MKTSELSVIWNYAQNLFFYNANSGESRYYHQNINREISQYYFMSSYLQLFNKWDVAAGIKKKIYHRITTVHMYSYVSVTIGSQYSHRMYQFHNTK